MISFLIFIGILLSLIAIALIGLAVALSMKKAPSKKSIPSITRIMFVTTQISAVLWVFTSYAIAIYSTVRLGQVYTMAELSSPAITTILGVSFLKVLENVFEHNDGAVWGHSTRTKDTMGTGDGTTTDPESTENAENAENNIQN